MSFALDARRLQARRSPRGPARARCGPRVAVGHDLDPDGFARLTNVLQASTGWSRPVRVSRPRSRVARIASGPAAVPDHGRGAGPRRPAPDRGRALRDPACPPRAILLPPHWDLGPRPPIGILGRGRHGLQRQRGRDRRRPPLPKIHGAEFQRSDLSPASLCPFRSENQIGPTSCLGYAEVDFQNRRGKHQRHHRPSHAVREPVINPRRRPSFHSSRSSGPIATDKVQVFGTSLS